MSSLATGRRMEVTDAFDAGGGPVPTWAQRRMVVIGPGRSLPYEAADWVGALVAVAAGEIDLACTHGGRRRFAAGALLPLEILPLLALENPGVDPLVLVSIRRRPEPMTSAPPGRHDGIPPPPSEEPTMPTRDTCPDGAPIWIELFSSDVPAARAFYGDLFGWTSTEPDPDMGGYFNFSKGGVLVGGGMGNDGSQGSPDAWTMYLATANAAATAAAVTEAGGQVFVEPMAVMDMGTMAVLSDPGGATVGMWQPGTHTGFGVLAEPGAPSWFELHTAAYDASVAFYREAFGWDTHVMSDADEFRYTTLGEGDGALAGIMDASTYLPDGAPAQWHTYFDVVDADATVARAVELGGSVQEPATDTPYGRIAALADPTGTSFRVRQP
ncbi:MAG: putative hydroxylase [Acidimicrobiales bacterium]|nr:putative hydroxylase [Acidimicrobiales bacterium]